MFFLDAHILSNTNMSLMSYWICDSLSRLTPSYLFGCTLDRMGLALTSYGTN